MPAPDCTFKMMMICAGILLIPSLVDFLPLTVTNTGWEEVAETVIPPVWYPFSGLILAGLFLYAGYKGKKEPGSTKCLLIIGMVVGIGNIIVVAYFGLIGVVLSTVCATVVPAVEGAAVGPGDAGIRSFCNMVGLLTLNCIVRFIITLVLLVSSCMGACCLNTGTTGVMVVQQPVVMIPGAVVQQPVQMVAVQAQPAP